MASTEHIKEFHVDREQLAELNELMYDTVQLIADSATEEHVLFDVVGAYGSEARTVLPEIANAMEDLAVYGETRAVVVHLPEETSDCYGPTPPDYPAGRNLHPSDVYRALLTGMPTGHGAKGLFAYRTKYFSGLQNNVIATKTTHSNISSSASGALVLHTEGVYQNYNKDIEPAAGELPRNSSPDFLSLHFVRNNEQAHLDVSVLKFDELSSGAREVLRQPILHLDPRRRPVSVVYGPAEDPWIRYNYHMAVNNPERVPDTQARESLAELDEHLADRITTIAVHAGSIVIFDNRRLLHGRSEYTPLTDGTGRWQRRVYHSTDEARMANFQIGPRTIDPAMVHTERPLMNNPGAHLNPYL